MRIVTKKKINNKAKRIRIINVAYNKIGFFS